VNPIKAVVLARWLREPLLQKGNVPPVDYKGRRQDVQRYGCEDVSFLWLSALISHRQTIAYCQRKKCHPTWYALIYGL
jgi:hypothetical protein